MRFTGGGVLDIGFGSGGVVRPLTPDPEAARDVAVLPDGTIVVVGSHSPTLDKALGLARGVQSDGRLVVAGQAVNGGSNGFGLIRLVP